MSSLSRARGAGIIYVVGDYTIREKEDLTFNFMQTVNKTYDDYFIINKDFRHASIYHKEQLELFNKLNYDIYDSDIIPDYIQTIVIKAESRWSMDEHWNEVFNENNSLIKLNDKFKDIRFATSLVELGESNEFLAESFVLFDGDRLYVDNLLYSADIKGSRNIIRMVEDFIASESYIRLSEFDILDLLKSSADFLKKEEGLNIEEGNSIN